MLSLLYTAKKSWAGDCLASVQDYIQYYILLILYGKVKMFVTQTPKLNLN